MLTRPSVLSPVFRRLALSVLAALLAGCAGVQQLPAAAPAENAPAAEAQPARELTPVALGVGYIPSVQFASIYAAIDQGYFAEEGIDLTLAHGFENDYLKLVGAGESRFMIGSGDQVIIGRAQGLPVRYVSVWFTSYPVVLMAKADAGISTLDDLAGKRVGLPGPFGANYVAYRAMLEAAGLSEADVRTESIGFTQATALQQGLVDAAVDYAANGPVVLALEGVETVQLTTEEALRIPANGLVTNEQTIADEPELVAGMVRALLRGVEFALANPDETFEIALTYVPEAASSREANRAVFDATLPFWQPVEGRAPGEISAAEWEAAAALLQRSGLVDQFVPADELYTNDFLPGE